MPFRVCFQAFEHGIEKADSLLSRVFAVKSDRADEHAIAVESGIDNLRIVERSRD
jgi:hypothetical protein